MKEIWKTSIRFMLLCTIGLGGVYTLGVTGIGQLFFSEEVNGSQIIHQGKFLGSKYIGQDFDNMASYFQSRPMAVSQLSPLAEEQEKLVRERTEKLLLENPTQTKVPVELVTASGSGVDPHISLEAAVFQQERIAKSRQLSVKEVAELIEAVKQVDFLSRRSYVNVLELNINLDAIS